MRIGLGLYSSTNRRAKADGNHLSLRAELLGRPGEGVDADVHRTNELGRGWGEQRRCVRKETNPRSETWPLRASDPLSQGMAATLAGGRC